MRKRECKKKKRKTSWIFASLEAPRTPSTLVMRPGAMPFLSKQQLSHNNLGHVLTRRPDIHWRPLIGYNDDKLTNRDATEGGDDKRDKATSLHL